MKKYTTLALAALLALSMSACGNSSAPETTVPSTQDTAETTTATTTEAATEETIAPAFEEIILADNEALTFKITGIEEDAIWGYSLKVYIENKTDKALMFTVNDVSVNGFMCDPFWAESVAPKKKSNSSISWLDSAFEENGITQVEDITFTLRVYDSNDFLAEDVLNETFIIHP